MDPSLDDTRSDKTSASSPAPSPAPATSYSGSPLQTPASNSVDLRVESLHPTEQAILEANAYFESFAQAKAFLWEYAIAHGHGIVIARSQGGKQVYPDGTQHQRRVKWQCERGGTEKHPPANKKPKKRTYTVTNRCNCPWKAVTHWSTIKQQWGVAILLEDHNHRMAPHPELSASYRRYKREIREKETGIPLLDRVQELVQNGRSCGQIAATLSEPESPVTAEDVKWLMRKLRRMRFGPRSATQLFLRELEELQRQGQAILEVYEDPQTMRISRVFWAFKDSIDLWRKNPEYLSFDNTYKVNRFNMPLLQIGGVTGLNTNYSVAYVLTSGEAEDTFFWALSRLKDLASAHEVPMPLVVMSDYDRAFKNAASKVFEDSQQQLCVWHILKNVVHNIKQKWEGPLGDFAGGISENARIRGNVPASTEEAAADANSDQYDDEGFIPAAERDVEALVASSTEKPPADRQVLENDQPLEERRRQLALNNWPSTPQGLLDCWRAMVYANDEEAFETQWVTLQTQFKSQAGKPFYYSRESR